MLHENSSVAFKGRRDGLPGDPRARAHSHTRMCHTPTSSSWRKLQPQCETSVNKCAPGVKVQHTSIFSPASYSSQETFEAAMGWYGFALRATKFVYTYSTIHQLTLWCLEDVTDTLFGGAPQHTRPSMSSVCDPLKTQLISHDEISSSASSVFIFAALMWGVAGRCVWKTQQIQKTLSMHCLVWDETCFNKAGVKVRMLRSPECWKKTKKKHQKYQTSDIRGWKLLPHITFVVVQR